MFFSPPLLSSPNQAVSVPASWAIQHQNADRPTAGIRFNTNGRLQYRTHYTPQYYNASDVDMWISQDMASRDSFDAADYECMLSDLAGDTAYFDGAAQDVWLRLTEHREWWIQHDAPFITRTVTAVITVRHRTNTSNTASGNISLKAIDPGL